MLGVRNPPKLKVSDTTNQTGGGREKGEGEGTG